MVSVKPTESKGRITVRSNNDTTVFGIKDNLSEYYAKQAENWAHSEGMVNGTDYSSKYYAEQSKASAQVAYEAKTVAQELINGFDNNVQIAKDDIEQNRINSINAIDNACSVALGDMYEKSDEVLTGIEASKAEAVDSINSTKTTILNDIEFVADGEKKEINDLADEIKDSADTIINRVGFNMFDTVLKDHILTYEESKGLALQGTYVYKTAIAGERYGYPDFYAQVVKEYNEATGTETVNGVTVKVHSNGHKFYDIANKSAIDSSFNSLGTAWYYGVDTANERVFLPRNNYFEQVTGTTSEVGDSVEAGLPTHTHTRGTMNITGTWRQGGDGYGTIQTSGVVSGAFYKNGSELANTPSFGSTNGYVLGFDASKSWTGATSAPNNAIYGKSNTVQPNAVKKLLYICVGNTVSDTSWVDVVTQVQGGVKDLEDKTNEGIERLRQSSTALTQAQITNCITEVPQRIKLELSNGVLKLKAGSVVTVPNGFEADGTTPKFDYVNIESDKQLTVSDSGSTLSSSGWFVFISPTSFSPRNALQSNVYSGNTAPDIGNSTYASWYDTANNLMKHTNDKGVTWVNNYASFPLCSLTRTSGIATSIDQVFNGMGYIGSTIWVDKGVKGLIPNGRNEDGTLKNIEFTIDSVKTYTTTNTAGKTWGLYFNEDGSFNGFSLGVYKKSIKTLSDRPTNWTGGYCIYVEDENRNYVNQYVNPSRVIMVANVVIGSTSITSLIPKLPFRALDYNDKQEISGWGMPSSRATSLTLGSSGASYIAPANGYVVFRRTATAVGQYFELINNTSSAIQTWGQSGASSGVIGGFIPVQKGDQFAVAYTLGSATNQIFRFIYAEGAY